MTQAEDRVVSAKNIKELQACCIFFAKLMIGEPSLEAMPAPLTISLERVLDKKKSPKAEACCSLNL